MGYDFLSLSFEVGNVGDYKIVELSHEEVVIAKNLCPTFSTPFSSVSR